MSEDVRPPLREIIRGEQAMFKASGLRRTQREELIARGEFPKPVKLSKRAIGWFADEVAAWQAAHASERDGGGSD